MSSLLLQNVTGSNRLSENILIEYLCKFCLIFILIYVGQFKVKNSSETGLLARLKKFQKRAELVNKYPGLNMFPLLGSTPKMSHLIYKPSQGKINSLSKISTKNLKFFAWLKIHYNISNQSLFSQNLYLMSRFFSVVEAHVSKLWTNF